MLYTQLVPPCPLLFNFEPDSFNLFSVSSVSPVATIVVLEFPFVWDNFTESWKILPRLVGSTIAISRVLKSSGYRIDLCGYGELFVSQRRFFQSYLRDSRARRKS